MLLPLIGLHAVAGVAVLAAARRWGRRGLVVGGAAPALTALWAATQAGAVLDGHAVTERATWVPQLGLGVDVRLDAFSLLMTVLVSGVGTLVFAYAWHYFGSSDKVGRVAGLLTLFAGAMLGVVVADNLLLLYVCWELTSVTSYLLIGIDDAEPQARAAALQALLVTGLGGLAMLGGFVAIGQEAGTYRISELLADPPGGTTTAVALVLVLLGAFAKSAQYPFHGWLPAAMVAPTPISAYLHSAAMVKAGVYLVARLAPAFATSGPWRPLVVGVGLTTMLAGGLRALRPFDLKQLLAFGTVSQLGFMIVLLGLGTPGATAAGCALLLAHGLFKAALFMVVGIVDHDTHTRDVRGLPALGAGWTPLRAVALASAASMAAVPPLAGFVAKEEAYSALLNGSGGERLALVGVVAGSVLTVAYSLRLAAALWRPDLVSEAPAGRATLARGPAPAFVAPAALLAAGSVALGVAPGLWSGLVDGAARALDARSGTHLALWHGPTAALALSVATLVAGAVLFTGRRTVAAVQARLAPARTGADVYDGVVRGVLRLAARVTSVVQPGSLPIYAAVVLTTASLVPTVGMLAGDWWPGWPDLVGRPAHVPLAALLVVAALAATVATRRFAAALLLGVVGYGMAGLFVVQGAPDLALTQFAVETLSVVVFLLVLRRLPDRFEQRAPAAGRLHRLVVSGAVGVFVVLMALAAAGSRTAPAVSREMSARALPDGGGRNVVNVVLVDIRGMDTMGEITVLVAAGIGATALARAGEVPRRRPPLRGARRARQEARRP
ncbi:MAG TPA: hydrogen gas-evolving membrane-bound hydrogenase subunit E [Acidimicrobiales bacterium]|nr:hydrogen gas-evolving membrane-bound hydrogenase subunit E [Acidimicrobiales bacterium]